MSQLTQWLSRPRRPRRVLPRLLSGVRPHPFERILITGAAGYIGSILSERLLEAGHSVVGLDRLDFGDGALGRIRDHKRFELIEGDCRDVDAAARALKDADAVIHLAAVVGDPACAANEREAVETNRQATAMLAKLSRGLGVKRMLFASTCSVYGSNPETVDESSPLYPVSLYAETKIDAERLLLDAETDAFSPLSLRIGTAFGWSHRPRFDLLVNLLTAKARAEGRAVIFNGDRWRPFVHVQDIARGFETAVRAPKQAIHGRVLNLGSNTGNHQLSSIAEILKELHPEAEIVLEPTDDRRNYRVEFGEIERTLGYRATTTLQEGISEIDALLAEGRVEDYKQARYHNVLAMEERKTGALEERHTVDLMRLQQAVSEPSPTPAERASVS